MKVNTKTIKKIVKILQKGLDQGDTFNAVFDLIEKAVSYDSATLYIYNSTEDVLEIMHQVGDEVVDLVRNVPFPRGMGLSSWVSKLDRPVILESLVRSNPGRERRLASFISMPMRSNDKLIGVLNLGHSEPNIYLKEDADEYQQFVEQITIVIETFMLRKQLEIQNTQLSEALEELKNAQEQLVEKERLAAVGELVVTVNHEINNPLTSIIGLAEILELSHATATPERITEAITAILSESKRIQRITERLTRIESTDSIDYVDSTRRIILPS